MKLPTTWKHLRAALVLAHILAMVLTAIPAPVGGTDRAQWKNPTAQMEFAAYAKFLHVTPEYFEDNLFKLAMFWMELRFQWMKPINPYLQITGTDQPWRMFVGPDRFPPRFQVQYRTDDISDYTTLYEDRLPVYDWHEAFFRQERVRSYTYRYAWPEFGWAEVGNCKYLAKLVFEEKPEARGVRCRFWKQKTPSAAQVVAGVPPEPGDWFNVGEVHR